MDHLTIELDDDVRDALRARAANNGRSMEEEACRVLRETLEAFVRPHPLTEAERPSFTEAEIEERVRRILALGRNPAEAFDQKAFSDELNDFAP